MITRRDVLAAGLALGAGPLRAARGDGSLQAVWRGWRAELAASEARVRRRAWSLTPLAVQPPATAQALDRASTLYGAALPGQLRDVLSTCAAAVTFGWSIPPIMRPPDGLDLPTSGGLAGSVWSIDHLQGSAIDAFKELKENLPGGADGLGPDLSASWGRQFPWMVLDGGDILTIDMTTDGLQPVRCFSGDGDGLHGHVIAPDFLSFISTYVDLGCAGSGSQDWIRFMAWRDDGSTPIDADGSGARRWRDWFGREPEKRHPGEPPPAIAARTRSDFDLLETARVDNTWGWASALPRAPSPTASTPARAARRRAAS